MAVSQYYVDYGAGNDTTGDGTIGTPWKTIQKALDTITRNATDGDQVNVKAGTAQVLATTLSFATYGAPAEGAPLILRGYTSAAGDGGMGVIDANGVAAINHALNYFLLCDLELHSFGNNNGINMTGTQANMLRCKVHAGASSPVTKSLVLQAMTVEACHIYNAGTTGTGINFSNAVRNSYIANCPTLGINTSEASGNIILNCPTVGVKSSFDGQHVSGNIIWSTSAATGTAIAGTTGITTAKIVNNIIGGYSGAGGAAINVAAGIQWLGYNAYYNNTTDKTIGDIVMADLGGDVALGADPFTDAANGDFSLTPTAKAALRSLGWPSSYLGAHANSDPHITIGPMQYGPTPAAVDYPSAANVRDATSYGSGAYTGTLDLPAVADVQSGVTFDGATKTGTFAAPAVGDVQSGVTYGAAAEYTGTLALPTEAQVESGVGFGAGGTEFTGTLVTGGADPDWTADEKAQIRQALGVTGTKAVTSGGNLDGLLAVAPDNKPTVSATGETTANVTYWAGDAVAGAPALETTAQAILEDTGTTLPAAIAGVGAGSGTGYYSDTLESPSGTPVDGARVMLATDVDGLIVAYEARTDAFGVFEMRPDPGTYYRFIEAAGHTFTQGVAVLVEEV